LELEKKPDNLTSVSESWTIVCQIEKFGIFYFGCSDGVIRSTSDFITYNTLYTLSGTPEPFLAMVSVTITNGTSTLFFWTESTMYYRTTFTDGLAWVPAGNTIIVTSNVNSSPHRQVLHYSKLLVYFTNGTQIGKVDASIP